MCVGDPLTDNGRLFIKNLEEHIKQLRRRQQRITRPLAENAVEQVIH
jgi:hypothetical protein